MTLQVILYPIDLEDSGYEPVHFQQCLGCKTTVVIILYIFYDV